MPKTANGYAALGTLCGIAGLAAAWNGLSFVSLMMGFLCAALLGFAVHCDAIGREPDTRNTLLRWGVKNTKDR